MHHSNNIIVMIVTIVEAPGGRARPVLVWGSGFKLTNYKLIKPKHGAFL